MSDGHWFDRLTERVTRRDALKAAAVAGAALAVPAARPATAGAKSIAVGDCFKGCQWTAQHRYLAAADRCDVIGYLGLAQETVSYLYSGPLAAFFGATPAAVSKLACIDRAVLNNRDAALQCFDGTNCGGFDPTKPGGPCDTCSNNCCTCQNNVTGYVCCFYDCTDSTHSCCPS